MTRCADKGDMSAPNSPWTQVLQRDDRVLLGSLESMGWDEALVFSSIKDVLETLVVASHFSSQTRWGLRPASQETRTLATQFLVWMKKENRWQLLSNTWRDSSEGPWSLPYALSREYLRFRSAVGLSESAPRRRDGLESVTHAFLDVFASLTHHLPANQRLAYQLHLEGLLCHEIAALLNRSEASITKAIAQAKGRLQDNFGGKRAS
jgi:hypothetical protein